MGFICQDCGKDFGNNKEWFEDHRKAHWYDSKYELKVVIKKPQRVTLNRIKREIVSGKIRVWMDYDGYICFENASNKEMFSVNPYYDMVGNKIEVE